MIVNLISILCTFGVCLNVLFRMPPICAEGSEVFRVKKSNHSKKIVKQLKREYKEDLEKSGCVKQESKSGLFAVIRMYNTASLLLDTLHLTACLTIQLEQYGNAFRKYAFNCWDFKATYL